ncbi:cbb3-type cytochrome c oxidase subunit I [Flaviaesturariibacter amylovorans]|uniref:Nitric-oxide reductase large subunit n=1 Tax=Flaviaesturariibacter amylovorans TaxID=1084520 RepID=A0ABP8H5I7_9BACT
MKPADTLKPPVPVRLVPAFFALSLSYLLLGLLFGTVGSLQYVLPDFLKEALSFQKTRPLHVYLVTSWIFTAAQGAVYYFLPRAAGRPLRWPAGAWLHWALQLLTSAIIVGCFFTGRFGGREYLEFPPALGGLIALSWVPFAVNFFATLRPRYRNAPVYHYSWTVGIVFFFITLSESYLWLVDHFFDNPVRDITVQWKALGSMVGSWNMLIYGCTMFVMSRIKGNEELARSRGAFFFFFLGFTNLLFNWGHHTYVVPAAPWVRNVSYIISMTELVLLAQLLWNFRRSLSEAQLSFRKLTCRLISLADGWVLLNLTVAIAISVPALNRYTHGTHITVAHAMGATIGINTMLLLASLTYVLQQEKPRALARYLGPLKRGVTLTNGALLVFWIALVGGGLVKIAGQLESQSFATIMQHCAPFFKLFAGSGLLILVGLTMVIFGLLGVLAAREGRPAATAPKAGVGRSRQPANAHAPQAASQAPAQV